MGRRFHFWLLVVLASWLPQAGAAAQSVPADWTSVDIGSPAVHGSASFNGSTISISGGGSGPSGAADQLTFVYQSLTGDGAIVARLDELTATSDLGRAGLMIRESLVPESKEAVVLVSPHDGVAFQRRPLTDTVTTTLALVPAQAAPHWLRLERRGPMLNAFRSSDGAAWISIGTDAIAMLPTVYVGLVVTNAKVDSDATAAFSSVSVSSIATAPAHLPVGWSSTDVGMPAQRGTATLTAGIFAVTGGGTDIRGTADQFHYVYRRVTGDVEITSRVLAVEAVDPWTKGGLMLRGGLTANAAHVSLFVTPARGVAFGYRPVAGGGTLYTKVARGRPPRWVKLQRRGARVTAYQSVDGRRWVRSGIAHLALPTIYVGLAVTSRDPTTTATTLFDHVVVGSPNDPPSVILTAPDDYAMFVAPATVDISAAAGDDDGWVGRVDFFAGSTPIGSSTTVPYTMTWSEVPPGIYPLRAVAQDNDRAIGISLARTIIVSPVAGSYYAVFTPSSNHSRSVTAYELDVYEPDADPNVAEPIATAFLGKPAVVAGECVIDITATLKTLPPGTFLATVTAFGPGGSAQSDASTFAH